MPRPMARRPGEQPGRIRSRIDLYHRLSVYPLTVAPLRERRDDILALAGRFLSSDQRRLGLRGVRLSAGVRKWLLQSECPGNVRELQHALSRGVIRALSEGQRKDVIIEIGVPHLELERPPSPSMEIIQSDADGEERELALSDAADNFKRSLVEARLRRHAGNKFAAAQSLGMNRGNVHRLLKRLGVE